MYIAITADGESLSSNVSSEFESCKFLLIVDMEDLGLHAIKNDAEMPEVALAEKVIDYDCEAIITGKLNPSVFDILADACVTRYAGAGFSTAEALGLMEKYQLKMIVNHEGSDKSDGHHHHS